jgi:thiosulfate/3-mercaptopyruvate sulfurtransferase
VNAELLVSPQRLSQLLDAGRCVVVDCRFDLTHAAKGRQDYLAGHIPGAHYGHLNEDLASPITQRSGRHPLPEPDAFAAFLARLGWTGDKLLVAHDERNNAIAARLWWLMRYFGQQAALLDGGLEAWTRSGMPLEAGAVHCQPAEPAVLQGNVAMTAAVEDIVSDLGQGFLTLVDARAAERYSGAVEPLDARGGHIPGALNRPFASNLDQQGCFKPAQQLRSEFEALLQQRPLASVVHSCGSGVTACHNRFAMELAGLQASRIYPGSWSEWVRDESRPVATSAA